MANSTMRQTFCRFCSIFCLLSLPTSAHAQKPTAATALRDIQNTYNFDPLKLSFEDQAKRAPRLSALWDRYDKTSDVYRDALRTALKTPGARELLYCDGGMQLLAKSKLPEDLNLGLQSISKCGLAEIEHTPYFYTMQRIGFTWNRHSRFAVSNTRQAEVFGVYSCSRSQFGSGLCVHLSSSGAGRKQICAPSCGTSQNRERSNRVRDTHQGALLCSHVPGGVGAQIAC